MFIVFFHFKITFYYLLWLSLVKTLKLSLNHSVIKVWIHTLVHSRLKCLAYLWSKIPIFQRAGMRKGVVYDRNHLFGLGSDTKKIGQNFRPIPKLTKTIKCKIGKRYIKGSAKTFHVKSITHYQLTILTSN